MNLSLWFPECFQSVKNADSIEKISEDAVILVYTFESKSE